jgi:hypothetical protein
VSRSIVATLVGLMLAFAGTQRSEASIIDTYTGWTGGGIMSFGEGYNATMGQTFTVVAPDTQLDSFSFWLLHSWPNPSTLNPLTWPTWGNNHYNFKAYVMEWDASNLHPTGAQLYSSPLQSPTIHYAWPYSRSDFQQFTFNTGGVRLEAGHQYVAFLCAAGYFDYYVDQYGHSQELIHEAVFGTRGAGNNPYPGGALYWLNNGNDFSKVTTQSWTDGGWVGDATFQADFSPIPEPSTLVVWAGLAATGAFIAWRRRKGRS